MHGSHPPAPICNAMMMMMVVMMMMMMNIGKNTRFVAVTGGDVAEGAGGGEE